MPSYSRPSVSTDRSSSFQENNMQSPSSASGNGICLQRDAIDPVALNQERIERTNDVRQRLGPLIEKLKDSVKNIQTIENSIRASADGGSECRADGDGKSKAFRSERSQKLIDQSMEMVKKKMFRLKSMEEQLMTFEDRNLHLNQYCQQQMSRRSVEKTEVLEDGSEYQHRIKELEEEVLQLKEKAALVDDLRMEKERLLERTRHVELLERELMVEKSLRQMLESKLNRSICCMNEKVVNYDSFNGKFETSTRIFENSMQTLEAKESEVMSSSGTVESSGTNDSTVLTEPMLSISWTESSVSTDDASTHDNNDSNANEDSSSPSTVEILMAKIETLIRENVELRDSKNRTLNKYKSLCKEMKSQPTVGC